jgi:RNA recognition motif-containing protein
MEKENSVYIGNIPKNYPFKELEKLFEEDAGFKKLESVGQEKSYKFAIFNNFMALENCLMKGPKIKDNHWFYLTKGKRNTNVKLTVKSYSEIESKLNLLQSAKSEIKFRVLNIDYVQDRDIVFLTFSTRQEAEAAVSYFGSNNCKYVDRQEIPDCALYVTFDPTSIPRKLITNNNIDFIYEELYNLFSFGDKVPCKVEVYRIDGGEYEGKANIDYNASSDGQRVYNYNLYICIYVYY